VAAAYVAAMALYIYGIAEPDVGYGSDIADWIGIAALMAVAVAVRGLSRSPL
jgi:hypothetical protein